MNIGYLDGLEFMGKKVQEVFSQELFFELLRVSVFTLRTMGWTD